MEQPDSLILPFGVNAEPGTIEPIPNDRAPEDLPERATWNDGFPAVTMTPLAAGGIPPRGQDFNGILNAISEHTVFTNSGGQYRWDADFVAATGGYSKGAVLQSDNGLSAYVSTIDNNTINFNTTPSSIGNQWVPYAGDSIPTQTQAVWNAGTLTTESRISPAKLQAKLINFAPVQAQSIWNTGTSSAESRLSPLKLHTKLLDFAPAQTQATWNTGASTIESRISPAKLQVKLNLHAPQLSQAEWNNGVSGVEALISPGKLANRLRHAVPLGTTNLNDYDSPAHIGAYYQVLTGNATVARSYPENSGAGALEVLHGGPYGGVIQRYTMHLIGSASEPTRTCWMRSNATVDGEWTDWVRLITDRNVASTSSPGIVQLNNTVTSTSTTQAATANAVRLAESTLAGQPPSFYRNASNLNAGTVPRERLPVGTTGLRGAVQLYGGVDSTSNELAATANAVRLAANQLEGQGAAFYRNASNLNTGTVPTVRLPWASTTDRGVTRLVNSVDSTATDLAATANAVRLAASVGVSQSYVDVTSSRDANTTYTNSTGRPILVCVTSSDIISNQTGITFYINGVRMAQQQGPGGANFTGYSSVSLVIPPGSTYRVEIHTNDSIDKWVELR